MRNISALGFSNTGPWSRSILKKKRRDFKCIDDVVAQKLLRGNWIPPRCLVKLNISHIKFVVTSAFSWISYVGVGGKLFIFVYKKNKKQLLNMLCIAGFCKYFVRSFFFFFFYRFKEKKNITVSNEFICVIKSGIQTMTGLSRECVVIYITILYYGFSTLKGRFCGKLLENWLLGTGLMCVLLTLPRSLCRAIDPGITFSPCIALNTEERSRMFHRRCQAKRCRKVQ